jgi:2-polyprenyl-3-methyl-5-hydroxy-6-metoxy-1,4-benzoquinol methylase
MTGTAEQPGSNAQRFALQASLRRRSAGAGSFSAPCLPALLDHYLQKLEALFQVLDRPLAPDELASLRRAFREQLERGFDSSPYARFVFEYAPSATNPLLIDCRISVNAPSLDEQYREWLRTTAGEQPFGSHADAMVLELARALGDPRARVLDVGAGSGRNAIALARLGHAVDALEPVSELAQTIRAAAEREALSVNVAETDVLRGASELPAGAYALVVLSEVTPHFSRAETARVLPELARAVAPGGRLLLNAFLTGPGYQPDELAAQAAQALWSTFFAIEELSAALESAGLELRAVTPCLEYERAHLPEGAWPPTAWYENWARGLNLFAATPESAPIELCWLVYGKVRETV